MKKSIKIKKKNDLINYKDISIDLCRFKYIKKIKDIFKKYIDNESLINKITRSILIRDIKSDSSIIEDQFLFKNKKIIIKDYFENSDTRKNIKREINKLIYDFIEEKNNITEIPLILYNVDDDENIRLYILKTTTNYENEVINFNIQKKIFYKLIKTYILKYKVMQYDLNYFINVIYKTLYIYTTLNLEIYKIKNNLFGNCFFNTNYLNLLPSLEKTFGGIDFYKNVFLKNGEFNLGILYDDKIFVFDIIKYFLINKTSNVKLNIYTLFKLNKSSKVISMEIDMMTLNYKKYKQKIKVFKTLF